MNARPSKRATGPIARWYARRASFLYAWSSRFSNRMRRWAEEFPSAWRALQPAWPVALVAAASSVLLTIPRQGREALEVTIDLSASGANYQWFAFAVALLLLHSLMMMGAAFFLLSIDRRPDRHLELQDLDEREEREAAEPRTPQDPLSPSITLRTRTALALGLLLPASLIAALVGSYAFEGLITLESLWWLALWLAGAMFLLLALGVRVEESLTWAVPLGVLLAGGSAAALAYLDPASTILENLRPWGPWLTAAGAASLWHGIARFLDWRSHRRLEEIRAAHAARQARGEPTPRLVAMIPRFWYSLRTFCRYPTRNVIAVLLALFAVVWFPRPDVDDYAHYVAGGLAAVGVIVAIVFLHSVTRARLMREHEGQGERRLVVDRRAEHYYRGVALLCLLLVPIALWPPPVYRAIGPVAVLLVGVMGVSVVLVWFVRAAISPARPLFSAPVEVPWQGRPFFLIGALAERLQGTLTPARILAIGIALLLTDWFIISSVAGLMQMALWAAYALSIAAVAIVAVLSWWNLLLFRKRRRKRPVSAIAGAIATVGVITLIPAAGAAAALLRIDPDWPVAKTAAGLVLTLFAPVVAFQAAAIWDRVRVLERRDPIRVPTLLMIAPFVVMGLGENHYIAMTPAVVSDAAGAASRDAESALVVPGAEAHARAWLQARIARDPDGPITAIVVLAEGGGIRAASHAGMTLAQLDAALPRYCEQQGRDDSALCASSNLLDQIYALSGISGGSVGVAAYLAAKADEAELGAASPGLMLMNVFDTVGADHVSALFAGMFAVDLPIVLLPTQLPHDLFRDLGLYRQEDYRYTLINRRRGLFDRADFFERSLGSAWRGADPQKDWFELPFEHVVETAAARSPDGVAPVVMFGTFEARDAHLAATSNVAFDRCPYATHFEPSTGAIEPDRNTAESAVSAPEPEVIYSEFASVQDCFPQNRVEDGAFIREITMPLSTAAHLSARFPGSNPSAVVETYDGDKWVERRFVDGGYYDNSGATGALHALRALDDAARELGVADRLRVAVLHVFTRDVQTTEEAPPPRDSVASELVTPLNAVWSARDRSGRQPVRMLCQYLGSSDPLIADQICAELETFRQADRDEMMAWKDASCPPPVIRAVLDRHYEIAERARTATPRDVTRYAVPWVNAPLDIADRPESQDPPYALLGWSLKAETQTHINEVAAAIATQTLSALDEVVRPGSVRMEDPSRLWGCPTP